MVKFDVMMEYLPLYKDALFLTLGIGWLGILLSLVLGVICTVILRFHIPVLFQIVKVYVEVFRNTPLLVQLFFIYFGLPRIGIMLSAQVCGVFGLGMLGGAYMTETFRCGLDAVEKIQYESAVSLGMTPLQALRYVIFPQAITISAPGMVANVIFLLKETSVFSAISLMDLMFTAKDLIGLYYKTTECLFLLVIFYLMMLLPVSILGSILERRIRYAGFGD